MTKNQFIQFVNDYIVAVLKMNAPKRTGNLAYNSIRLVGNEIKVGGEIAPYAVYTEENNKSSKGWIKRTIQSLIPTIEQLAKNNISEEEFRKLIDETNKNVDLQFENIANKYLEYMQKLTAKGK
ncbi:MAG TPA: hypothetical protein GX708_01210 [Gallicola sp.]|nr:hypothetical protein [Gallicola sp.]